MTGNVTITVVRRSTTTDRYQDVVSSPGSPAPQRHQVRGCAVSPRSSNDLFGPGRQGVLVGLDVLAPAGADIRARDQVEVDGDLFDVDGDIGRWRSPYSKLGGLAFALRRAVG